MADLWTGGRLNGWRRCCVSKLKSLFVKSRDPVLRRMWVLSRALADLYIYFLQLNSLLQFLLPLPVCLSLSLRATRNVHRLWAWWRRRRRQPAWRRWSGCSGTWRRSGTSSTGWTSYWPWSPTLGGKDKGKVCVCMSESERERAERDKKKNGNFGQVKEVS